MYQFNPVERAPDLEFTTFLYTLAILSQILLATHIGIKQTRFQQHLKIFYTFTQIFLFEISGQL